MIIIYVTIPSSQGKVRINLRIFGLHKFWEHAYLLSYKYLFICHYCNKKIRLDASFLFRHPVVAGQPNRWAIIEQHWARSLRNTRFSSTIIYKFSADDNKSLYIGWYIQKLNLADINRIILVQKLPLQFFWPWSPRHWPCRASL